jgi:hypothetical protein
MNASESWPPCVFTGRRPAGQRIAPFPRNGPPSPGAQNPSPRGRRGPWRSGRRASRRRRRRGRGHCTPDRSAATQPAVERQPVVRMVMRRTHALDAGEHVSRRLAKTRAPAVVRTARSLRQSQRHAQCSATGRRVMVGQRERLAHQRAGCAPHGCAAHDLAQVVWWCRDRACAGARWRHLLHRRHDAERHLPLVIPRARRDLSHGRPLRVLPPKDGAPAVRARNVRTTDAWPGQRAAACRTTAQ